MSQADTALKRLLHRSDRASVERALAYTILAVATIYTLWLGRPDAALTGGAPPRSDLGGHLVAIKHLIDVSIPSGHLHDWSHQWFGGYPSFYFYFPLPALLIAALVVAAPLNVAGKLIAIAAPALLPPSTFVFVRALGFGRLAAACAAIGSVAFLSLTSQYIFGGNVLSSVIGEYSFALAFAFALIYLSRVALVLRGERHVVMLALALAATALSHTIPTLFAVLVSSSALRPRDARRQVLLSWAVGFGLSAFWAVPFLLRARFMGHIRWLYDVDLLSLFPLPVLMILPWTLAAGWALRTQLSKLTLLIITAAIALASYLLPHGLFAQGRGLPVWHYTLYTWTSLGVAAGLQRAWRAQNRLQVTAWAAGLVMLIGVAAIQVDIVRKRSGELLSAAAPDRPAYESLRARIAQLPPGRLHWEYRRNEEELLGGRLPLARIPAEVLGARTSQGLLVESALTSAAYQYLYFNVSWDSLGARYWELPARNDRNDERMRARLRQLGIGYFVTFSPQAGAWARSAPADFAPLATDSAWTIWQVRNTAVVEALRVRPRLLEKASWRDEVAQWLETTADSLPWPIITADRPPALARAGLADTTLLISATLGHRQVRFSTAAVGVPHVVRVTYFPNWRAYGAAGPYLTVPGFMIVVPNRSDVVLRFETTWVERAGLVVSVVTLVGLIAFAIGGRWNRSRPFEDANSAAPERERAPSTVV